MDIQNQYIDLSWPDWSNLNLTHKPKCNPIFSSPTQFDLIQSNLLYLIYLMYPISSYLIPSYMNLFTWSSLFLSCSSIHQTDPSIHLYIYLPISLSLSVSLSLSLSLSLFLSLSLYIRWIHMICNPFWPTSKIKEIAKHHVFLPILSEKKPDSALNRLHRHELIGVQLLSGDSHWDRESGFLGIWSGFIWFVSK